MAKQKKKKKRRGFRLFVKIQLVLIVLVLACLLYTSSLLSAICQVLLTKGLPRQSQVLFYKPLILPDSALPL